MLVVSDGKSKLGAYILLLHPQRRQQQCYKCGKSEEVKSTNCEPCSVFASRTEYHHGIVGWIGNDAHNVGKVLKRAELKCQRSQRATFWQVAIKITYSSTALTPPQNVLKASFFLPSINWHVPFLVVSKEKVNKRTVAETAALAAQFGTSSSNSSKELDYSADVFNSNFAGVFLTDFLNSFSANGYLRSS